MPKYTSFDRREIIRERFSEVENVVVKIRVVERSASSAGESESKGRDVMAYSHWSIEAIASTATSSLQSIRVK